mgnify:CR=1 FL=1
MSKNFPKLLKLMMDDMSNVSYLYKPTHHWQRTVDELLYDIRERGLKDFRATQSFLRAFIPSYAFPNYYHDSKIYNCVKKAFHEASPRESEIEKSQTSPTRLKFDLRLTDLLAGRLHALSDYRVFLASNKCGPPYTKLASESQVGNPLEQFNFDGRRYSRAFMNYLLGINYLKANCSTKNIKTVLEIGGGYGSLGEILLSDRRNKCLYINVDIPPTSYIATYYLKQVFGPSVVGDYSLFRESPTIEIDSIRKKYKAVVLCPWQLPKLVGEVDLFVNYHSFAEMEPDVVNNYCRLIYQLQARYILLRNLREGKQIMKPQGLYGVKTPILGEDYDKYFAEYKIVGVNTIPFGFQTEDKFHSEVRIYVRSIFQD